MCVSLSFEFFLIIIIYYSMIYLKGVFYTEISSITLILSSYMVALFEFVEIR